MCKIKIEMYLNNDNLDNKVAPDKPLEETANDPWRGFMLFGKFLFLILLCYWANIVLRQKPAGELTWIFLNNVDLIFHEGGHLIFSVFGEVVSYMGGTLMQFLVPMLVIAVFAWKKEWFSTMFGIFWLGESLINSSYYVRDAQVQQLELLGGGIHDWFWMLSRWNILDKNLVIGEWFFNIGSVLIVAALIGMLVEMPMSYFRKDKIVEPDRS